MLSILVLSLPYKLIGNNKKMKIERAVEVGGKITLRKEAKEVINKQIEKINQLNRLQQKKQNLESKIKRLNYKLN